ncbi:hypothetical protein AB0E77_23865 [Streptomyces sp. NPDC032940]|uniref:hypothetical protein n=1 Tax=Streptomyces sp. NPDC032940 TaxID=3155366 RepID=UPI003408F215
MPLQAGDHRAARPRRGGLHRRRPAGRGFRLHGLAGAVVCAAVLPFAVASAGPVPHGGKDDDRAPGVVRLLPSDGDGTAPGRSGGGATPSEGGATPSGAGPDPATLPLGLATAVRCGPELASPEGVEAQTCVLTQGTGTWARTYYRNATGGALEMVLSLLGPDGHSLRMRCAVGAEDAPGMCETPREPLRGEPAGYTAVAEFVGRVGQGPLLLRTGSNMPAGKGR